MSGMLDWAKREIEIACKKERGNAKKDEFDYGSEQALEDAMIIAAQSNPSHV